jgi:MEDS: MEthanogen/methylotroph, DcmR Sensory domain
MSTAVSPVRLAGSPLGTVRHVCAFFGSDDEAYRVLVPFIVDGFGRGDKAVHVVRPGEETQHLDRLAAAGLDLDAINAAGQLELRANTETYLRDGRFDQDRRLAAFEGMASGNAAGGFPLSRIVCNMDWVADTPAMHNDVIEFESRVNDVWERHDDIVICVYDLKKMRGDMAIDIMRTHPIVLIGDVLQQNPFFVPPDRFLRERRGSMARGS